MGRLGLTFLGGFRARLDDGRVVSLPIKKAQGLLAYLAIPIGHAHPRDKLAALLWGDMQTPQARAGLRQTLFVVRKTTGFAIIAAGEDESISLDRSVVTVDVREFEDAVADGSVASLERATRLYQGDLLEGLSVAEAPFEEWLIAERLRLRELALEGMARLLALQRDAGALESAVHTALRLVTLDPLQEPVHRTLMRLYAQLGRRGAALRQYQVCVSALQRELRAEPESETKTLYREILQSRVTPLSSPSPRASADAARDPLAAEPALVGRDVELSELRDALQAAWAGRGQLVALIGEAGIGKSALAGALIADAVRKGGRVLRGRCYESEQVLAFGPWIDALRAGGIGDDRETLDKLGPVWRAELARLLPEIADAAPGPATAEPAQLFETVAQLVERISVARPVLLVLEDVQWADEMSLRLLAFIGRRLPRWRVLTVITARHEDLPDTTLLRRTLDELTHAGCVVRRDVGPLVRDDAITLFRALMPSHDVTLVEEPLWRASEGNPFMIVETVRALRGRSPGDDATALPLPERVRDLVAYRLERLAPRSRQLVAAAAVIGRPFDFALLQRAADLGEAEAADGVEELVRHRVLQGRGEILEFTHDRIREVADGQLQGPRRAIPYLAQAGRQASLRYAHRDAAACYRMALTALDRLPDRGERRAEEAELHVMLAQSLFQVGEFERAREAFDTAEILAVDDRCRGEVQAGMSYLLGAQGDFAGAIATGSRALDTARSLGDLGLQTWTSIGLGQAYLSTSDYPRAVERLRWAIDALKDVAVTERFRRGSLVPSVASRTYLAIALGHTGEFEEAIALGVEAGRIADEVDHFQERAWAGYTLGRVLVARGDVERAIPLLEQALPLCGEGRLPLYWPRVLATLGEAYVIEGRADEGAELLERAWADAQAITLIYGHPWILMLASAAYLEAGRLDDAERGALRALEMTRRHGARGDEAWSLHVLGRVATRRDPPDAERAHAQTLEALALATALGMAPLEARCHLALGALHHRMGRRDAARDALDRALPMLEAMGMRPWLRAARALREDGG